MKLKKIKGPIVALVLAGCAFGSFHLLKDWRFDTDAPEANFPPAANTAEARIQDVEHLALFFEYERSWTANSLTAAQAAYDTLAVQAADMTDAEFELAVARVVALAGNAHTKIREYNRTPRYNRLPIRGHWFEDGYFIVRAYKGFEQLLGRKLVAIEGYGIDEVANRLRQYIAGPTGTHRKYSPYLIESPELMFAAGISRSPDSMEMTFEDPHDTFNVGQEVVQFDAPFPSSSDQIARTHYLLTAEVYSTSQPDWKMTAQDLENTPQYLRYPAELMQSHDIPELEARYVQFWYNNDSGSTSIKNFCHDELKRYQSSPSRNLIIDQRFNGGGNLNKTKSCMEGFAKSVPKDGRLYVIAGGATFSAGMYSAAFLLSSAGDQATLVGESMGDSMQSWGEDNLLRLPNSEIEIKFSTGMHDLSRPCGDWKKCYWGTIFLDLGLESLDPDIEAPLYYEDYVSQRDPAFEAIRIHQGL